MNGTDIKKAAINKAKQVAQAANGNGGKKRRKGQDLKPIITTEQQQQQQQQQGSQNASPASTGSFQYKYVCSHLPHITHPVAATALAVARTLSLHFACIHLHQAQPPHRVAP
jgi:serine/threonine-protein kinase SRPK3